MTSLSATARSLFAPGKGILAADETVPHADSYLKAHGAPEGEEARREYRDLFLATPGIETYLTGVILHTETLTQKADDETPFTELLASCGVMPGIKVDEGSDALEGSPDETITKGLLGLSERLSTYRELHKTRFTKWRSAIRIDGDRLPTKQALLENAKRLASYACESQKEGLVPILEPEVLLAGNHSRLRSRKVLEETLSMLFMTLDEQCADLSGAVLKTSMVISGSESGRKDTPEEVALDTVEALMACVPSDIAGIVFLSGGQTPDQATANLAAITRVAREKKAPWPLTFSYARALQEEAITVWAGKEENVPAAREAFLARLKKLSEALA